MPDPEKILSTVRRATMLFRSTPGRFGGVITLDPAVVNDVMIVGDLHGNLLAFRSALETAALASNPSRHLVLQELIHGKLMYPNDQGTARTSSSTWSPRSCQYPDRVHLILGNHELSELTGRPIGKNGVFLNALFRQGIETAYRNRASEVYSAYQDLFAALPLAVRTPNRVFLCHTIPDGYELDGIDLEVLKLNEWPAEAMKRHGTVYCLTWGRDTSPETVDRFAAMIDVDLFVTGHQPCDTGFRQANHRQIIIDGTDPCPTYCLFPARAPLTIDALMGHVRGFPGVPTG